MIRTGGVAALLLAAACASRAPRVVPVEIRGFAFVPPTVEVHAGDTLQWINHDVVPHTATDSAGGWDTGQIAAGDTGRWVAATPGRHAYVCAYHPGMRAELVVR